MDETTITLVARAARVCKRFCRYGEAHAASLKAFKLFLEDRARYREIVAHLRGVSLELADLLEDDVMRRLVCARACRIAGSEWAVDRRLFDQAHTEVILEDEADMPPLPETTIRRFGEGTPHVIQHRA